MKGNYQSLTQFAQEIERRDAQKKDMIANGAALKMNQDGATMNVGGDDYGINDFAHRQIAQKFGKIPAAYYDAIATVPGLRAQNVNGWIQKDEKEKHLIRTLDGNVRAVLSNGFKAIDHNDVLRDSIFPVVQEYKDTMKVLSHSITDTRFYLQLAFPTLAAEIKKGDEVYYGITITNSEVGKGALDVKSMTWRLICANGAIAESLFRKYHVGKRVNDGEDFGLYKSDTIEAELKSYRLRLRDVLENALKGDIFRMIVERMQGAVEDQIVNITPTVENVTKKLGIEQFKDKMIENIIRDGNINRWGLANSITALAHNIENPDRQYDIEKMGQQIIELSPKDWKVLAA